MFPSNLCYGLLESNYDSSDENLVHKNKKLSFKVGMWLSRCFEIKSFRSCKISRYLLDNLTSVPTTAQKILPNAKKVLVGQLRWTHPLFSEKFFFKRPSGDVEISYDKPYGKSLPKFEFFCSKCQIDFKKSFFLKTIYQKRSNGHIEWSAVLSTLRKVAR